MNYKADSSFLPERAWRARFKGPGLPGIVTGKRRQAGAVSLCVPRRIIKISNHALDVFSITDGDSVALIMFLYSASSSEARQALLSEKLELVRTGSASIPRKTTKSNKKSYGCAKRQQQKASVRSRDKYVQAIFLASYRNADSWNSNYLKTAMNTV